MSITKKGQVGELWRPCRPACFRANQSPLLEEIGGRKLISTASLAVCYQLRHKTVSFGRSWTNPRTNGIVVALLTLAADDRENREEESES